METRNNITLINSDGNSNYLENCSWEDFYLFPHHYGRGYMQDFTLPGGISLEIYDYELLDNVSFKLPVREHCLEFVMQLAGNFWVETDTKVTNISSGTSSLYGAGIAEKCTSNWQGKQQHCGICVHIDVETLKSFFADAAGEFPIELQPLIKDNDWQNIFPNLQISPAMQIVSQQIFNCPYQGLTKQIYLQSKVMELLALHVEQLKPNHSTPPSDRQLKQEDIDRIHQAKKILCDRVQNPPSLLELSREVGLNDFKLKIGFRQCFDTTVFGYLHHYRMEQARELLERGNLTITGVARAVGYANRSHFAAAFKRKFGVNPSIYSHSQKCS